MSEKYIVHTDSAFIRKSGWKEYVLTHLDGNFFQLPEAFELFQHVPGYTPSVFAALDNNGKIAGILVSVLQQEPKLYAQLTSRSIIWGGPLVDNNEVCEILLKQYQDTVGKKAIYTQFRNTFDTTKLKSSFQKANFNYLEHLNFLVHTKAESLEQLLAAMSKSKSRQIKKGLGSAEIIETNREEDINDFYLLLQKLYKEKVNKPLAPKEFFDFFREQLVPNGLGKFLLIRYEGKIIGGIVCPIFPGKAIYEWYIAGMDKEYKDQFPSILSTWAAIAEGQKMGLKHFDFLGAGKPDADYGVRDFKAKFGGELIQYGRYEKIHKPLLMKIGILGLKLLKFIK
ncbi:MAG: GNAT family N-acetyltransferase [Bacteroidetes bacterium]|nr:GNAT family N-acetyltransferase [Bacteroidota bacterium]